MSYPAQAEGLGKYNFLKGISLKKKAVEQLEFKYAYYAVVVLHVHYYGPSSPKLRVVSY